MEIDDDQLVKELNIWITGHFGFGRVLGGNRGPAQHKALPAAGPKADNALPAAGPRDRALPASCPRADKALPAALRLIRRCYWQNQPIYDGKGNVTGYRPIQVC